MNQQGSGRVGCISPRSKTFKARQGKNLLRRKRERERESIKRRPHYHAPCKMSLVLHLDLQCNYNQLTEGK